MTRSTFAPAFVAGLMATLASLCSAGTWTPDPSLTNPSRHVALYNIGRSYCDANWDATQGLSKIAGSWEVRSNFNYAYGLMITGDPTDITRAKAIITKLLQASTTQQEVNRNQYTLSVT